MKIPIEKDLYLDLLKESHAEELFALTDKNRKYLRKWLPWVDGTQTVADTENFIKTSKKQRKTKNGMQFTIKYKNKISGMIGLIFIDKLNWKTEIGYWLSSKQTGKGIVTKSCKALIDHCFNNLNLNKIMIRCAPGNKPSIGIPQRLKFKKEGLLREDTILYGKFEDSILFSLLRKEWEKQINSCHDDQAENYDERVYKDSKKSDNFIREKYFEVHKEVLSMADLKAGDNLLDIGIGTGLLEELISEEINVCGIDISEKMMGEIKEKNLKVKLSKGSFNKIPYEDKRFNIIVSCFAFHHLTDEEKEDSILEMKRVLKDKGRIVIGDFMYLNENSKKDLIEKFRREGRKDMMEEMEDENFTNIESFKNKLAENGFDAEYKQVSTISWIIKVMLNVDNPSSDLKKNTL